MTKTFEVMRVKHKRTNTKIWKFKHYYPTFLA